MVGEMQHVRGRFDALAAYEAAQMYYGENATQAEVAKRLNVSRPTVSRLLAEARRIGLVHIEIRRPEEVAAATAGDHGELQEKLGIRGLYVAPGSQGGGDVAGLQACAAEALADIGMRPGDTLLLASGEMVYQLSRSSLGVSPGLQIAPTVGGVAEQEPWHQINETVRRFAELTYGRAHPLFATAMPTEAMLRTLQEDPDFLAITSLWDTADVALVGIGAPTSSRLSISKYVPAQAHELRTAVGDVSLNFFDLDGERVDFEGSDRMVHISADQLRKVPTTVAAAVGIAKVTSIVGAARAGLFDVLVTDSVTVSALSDHLKRWAR